MNYLPSACVVTRSGATTLARLAIPVTAAGSSENADTRVVPVFENEQLGEALQQLVDSGEAKAAPKKTAVFHDGGQRVILVGAGKRESADAERFRVAAAAAAKRAKDVGSRTIAWEVPDVAGPHLHPQGPPDARFQPGIPGGVGEASWEAAPSAGGNGRGWRDEL